MMGLGKRGMLAVGLVAAGLWGPFGCSEPSAGGGSGGGGTGGMPAGMGGLPNFGPPGGTGGLPLTGAGGAVFICPVGTGGGGYLYDCDEWLGEKPGAPVDFSCGQGVTGQGGEGGLGPDAPALQRVCAAESNPDFNGAHPVHHCLAELTDSVCSETHEADVKRCLSLDCPPYLPQGPSCALVSAECPGASQSCQWAAASVQNWDYVDTCFDDDEREGEACEARFMRCAWGL